MVVLLARSYSAICSYFTVCIKLYIIQGVIVRCSECAHRPLGMPCDIRRSSHSRHLSLSLSQLFACFCRRLVLNLARIRCISVQSEWICLTYATKKRAQMHDIWCRCVLFVICISRIWWMQMYFWTRLTKIYAVQHKRFFWVLRLVSDPGEDQDRNVAANVAHYVAEYERSLYRNATFWALCATKSTQTRF